MRGLLPKRARCLLEGVGRVFLGEVLLLSCGLLGAEWTKEQQDDEDKRLWAEDWDDDDVDDEFARQLRSELTKSGHIVKTQ